VTDRIFSFGTLQQAEVQTALFGRTLSMRPDALGGHTVGRVRITSESAIAASGSDVHPGLIRTGDAVDRVVGSLLEVSAEELERADRYEETDFARAKVTTESGHAAWVYYPRDRAAVIRD